MAPLLPEFATDDLEVAVTLLTRRYEWRGVLQHCFPLLRVDTHGSPSLLVTVFVFPAAYKWRVEREWKQISAQRAVEMGPGRHDGNHSHARALLRRAEKKVWREVLQLTLFDLTETHQSVLRF